MGRYVDDMVLVIHPDISDENFKSVDEYVKEISELYKDKGLNIHTTSDGTEKCYTYDSKRSKALDFNLLGYNIAKGNKKEDKLIFSLSQNKKEKIADRLKKTFATFNKLIDIIGYDGAAHYLFEALFLRCWNLRVD